MAYDPAGGYVVLFGGATNATFFSNGPCGPNGDDNAINAISEGDTWTYANGTWTNLTSRLSVSPPARSDAVMSYDPALGALVLFGGVHEQGSCENHTVSVLNDTWEFVGGHWSELFPSPSPPARIDASMAYDASDRVLVLFGGFQLENWSQSTTGDTWTFSNGTWQNRTSSLSLSPSPRALAGMASDGQNGAVVLFGGESEFDGGGRDDTWSFENGTWTNITARGSITPYPRFGPEMTTSPDGSILLTGGVEPMDNDTWEFREGAWYYLSPNVTSIPGGAISLGGAAAYPPGNLTIILGGFVAHGSPFDGALSDSGGPFYATFDLASWQVADPLPNGSLADVFPHLTLVVGSLSGTAPLTTAVDLEASGGTPPYATSVFQYSSVAQFGVVLYETTPCWNFTDPPTQNPNCLYPNQESWTNLSQSDVDEGWSGHLATVGTVTYGTSMGSGFSWMVEDSRGLFGFDTVYGSVVGPLSLTATYCLSDGSCGAQATGAGLATYQNATLQVTPYEWGGTYPYHSVISWGDGTFRSSGQDDYGGRHQYTSPGRFTVEVTVTDSGGASVWIVVMNLTVGRTSSSASGVEDAALTLGVLVPAAAPTYVLARRRRQSMEAKELVERLRDRGPGEDATTLPEPW
jgi:hypothetical protein